MRAIGQLPTQSSAARFSDLLHAEGIAHQLEAEAGGWTVWVHAEEQLDPAKELLNRFLTQPDDPALELRLRHARRRREPANRPASRMFRPEHIFRSRAGWGPGWLTLTLMVLSVGLTLLVAVEQGTTLERWLLICSHSGGFLPEVLSGQVWRLITPIFLHANPLHLLFNMLCLYQLGRLLEARLGTAQLGAMVLGLAVVSNLGQYLHTGPLFCGMSGVVYGLLGYAWMRGRFDPASGLFLHPQTVLIMLVWLVAGFVGLVPGLANMAHLTGLAAGMAWGYLVAGRSNRGG